MQDLVAKYQQYQDATYIYFLPLFCCQWLRYPSSVEEEGEYGEELPVEEDQ
jgi:hypothetical protein